MTLSLSLKLIVASCLTFGIAALFAIQLLSLTAFNQIQEHQLPDSPLPDSPFFYNSIGYTPTTTTTSLLSPAQHSSPPPSPTSHQKFTVVVGHATTQKDIRIIVDQLNQAGLPTVVTPTTTGSGKQLHRISMGQFSSQQEAHQAINTLQQRTAYEGSVIPVK